MADHKITLDQSKEADALLYNREYASPRWTVRQSKGFWPFRSSMETVTDSSSGDDHEAISVRSKEPRRYYRIVGTIIGILILAVYVVATAPMAVKAIAARHRYTCGSTKEEAIARGCTFDPLTVQWLPKQCSRKGLDQFLVAHGTDYSWRRSASGSESNDTSMDQIPNEPTWRYFADEAQTVEYVNGLMDAPIGHYTYYTTRGEHLAHCAFMLVRAAEARKAGERMDTLTEEYEHSVHCALFLWEYAKHAPHFNTINTPGDIILGSC